jgi:hypothetical protein
VSNLHPPPYRSRQIICLSHSESVRLPLQLPMRPSPHQLHVGPFHPVHVCTAQQHTPSHTVRCARLVHLCSTFSQLWHTVSSWAIQSSVARLNYLVLQPHRTQTPHHLSIPLLIHSPHTSSLTHIIHRSLLLAHLPTYPLLSLTHHWLIYLHTHQPIHSLAHSFTHCLPTNLLTHPPTHSHTLTRPTSHPLIVTRTGRDISLHL